MDKQVIYTIGYTLFQNGDYYDVDALFKTLQQFNVTHLVDVRSVPYSKQYPQCNAENLKVLGRRYNIPYIHMPEVGAKVDSSQDVFSKAVDIFFDDIFPISKSNRPEKTELLANEEIVDFRKFRNSEYFKDGLKRIETAYDKGFVLALMCSEKNPVDCHRYFFISKALEQKYGEWLEVKHIVQNQEGHIDTKSNAVLACQLQESIFKKTEIAKLDILNPSMFEPAKIDNYFGKTKQEKIEDFCDRYWNLMHGWKKYNNSLNNEEYD